MKRVGVAADHGAGRFEEGNVVSRLGLLGRALRRNSSWSPQTIPPTSSSRWLEPLPPSRWTESGDLRQWRRSRGGDDKMLGVCAGLVHDVFSAPQGVEDNDMNVICLGGKVLGSELAMELIETSLTAHFSGALRRQQRLAKYACWRGWWDHYEMEIHRDTQG